MQAGLGANEFAAAVKLAFIRAAAAGSARKGKLNVSAISVATGLTRKEVRSLLEVAREQPRLPARSTSQQRTTRVIQGWRTDPAFLDRAGNPATLAIKGAGSSFEVLVRRYAGDVTPMSVLSELERAGAVARVKSGRVQLRSQTGRGAAHRGETLTHMASRVHDLAATLVANESGDGRPTFVGFREASGLRTESGAVFNKTFTERAALLLDAVDRWLALQAASMPKSRGPEATGRRVGIGIYLLDQPEAQQALPARRIHRRKVKPPAA